MSEIIDEEDSILYIAEESSCEIIDEEDSILYIVGDDD